MKRIAGQLIRSGRVERSGRAYLGVSVATANGAQGVVVASVAAGGPAAKAGIRPGELIVGVDRQPTPTTDALATVLASLRPGRQVEVDLVDPGGAKRTVTVTLGEATG